MEYPLSNIEMKKCMKPTERGCLNHLADLHIEVSVSLFNVNRCKMAVPRCLDKVNRYCCN